MIDSFIVKKIPVAVSTTGLYLKAISSHGKVEEGMLTAPLEVVKPFDNYCNGRYNRKGRHRNHTLFSANKYVAIRGPVFEKALGGR